MLFMTVSWEAQEETTPMRVSPIVQLLFNITAFTIYFVFSRFDEHKPDDLQQGGALFAVVRLNFSTLWKRNLFTIIDESSAV